MLFLLLVVLLLGCVEAFIPLAPHLSSGLVRSETSLNSCRRNNKTEKRKRNRDYARKFQSKTGGSRRKMVVEQKRLQVADKENKFQDGVFKMTTDDDMPAYTGFDFI